MLSQPLLYHSLTSRSKAIDAYWYGGELKESLDDLARWNGQMLKRVITYLQSTRKHYLAILSRKRSAKVDEIGWKSFTSPRSPPELTGKTIINGLSEEEIRVIKDVLLRHRDFEETAFHQQRQRESHLRQAAATLTGSQANTLLPSTGNDPANHSQLSSSGDEGIGEEETVCTNCKQKRICTSVHMRQSPHETKLRILLCHLCSKHYELSFASGAWYHGWDREASLRWCDWMLNALKEAPNSPPTSPNSLSPGQQKLMKKNKRESIPYWDRRDILLKRDSCGRNRVGKIEMHINYEKGLNAVRVAVDKVCDMKAAPKAGTFVQACLLPERNSSDRCMSHRHFQDNAGNIQFNQLFIWTDVNHTELDKSHVEVSLWSLKPTALIGAADISLSILGSKSTVKPRLFGLFKSVSSTDEEEVHCVPTPSASMSSSANCNESRTDNLDESLTQKGFAQQMLEKLSRSPSRKRIKSSTACLTSDDIIEVLQPMDEEKQAFTDGNDEAFEPDRQRLSPAEHLVPLGSQQRSTSLPKFKREQSDLSLTSFISPFPSFNSLNVDTEDLEAQLEDRLFTGTPEIIVSNIDHPESSLPKKHCSESDIGSRAALVRSCGKTALSLDSSTWRGRILSHPLDATEMKITQHRGQKLLSERRISEEMPSSVDEQEDKESRFLLSNDSDMSEEESSEDEFMVRRHTSVPSLHLSKGSAELAAQLVGRIELCVVGSTHRLLVTIKRASGITLANSHIAAAAGVYCKVYLTMPNNKKLKGKTRMVPFSADLVFNQRLMFHGNATNSELKVMVWVSHGLVSKHSMLCGTTININQDLTELRQTRWYKLENAPEPDSGFGTMENRLFSSNPLRVLRPKLSVPSLRSLSRSFTDSSRKES